MLMRYLPGLLAGSCALLAVPALAQEPIPRPANERPELPRPQAPVQELPPPIVTAPCPEACPRPPVNVTIPAKIHVIEEARETTLPTLNVREVEVGRAIQTDLAVTYKEERRKVTVMVSKPRTVEQPMTITRTEMVPECDPCTGKTCMVPHPICETKMVKTTVFDVVPEEREILVRVPVIKPVEVPVAVTMLALEQITVPAIETRLRTEVVPPMTLTVLPPRPPAPLPPPCPPPCPAEGCPAPHR